MIVYHQIIIDCLGYMNAAQRIVGPNGLFAKYSQGIGRIIASDIKKGADSVGLKNLEYLLTVFGIRFVPGRAKRRTWRFGDHLEVMSGFLGYIQELLIDNAPDTVTGTVDTFYRG